LPDREGRLRFESRAYSRRGRDFGYHRGPASRA
jgi:hypothetical protein